MRITPAKLRFVATIRDSIDEEVSSIVHSFNRRLDQAFEREGLSGSWAHRLHDGTIVEICDSCVQIEWEEYAMGCRTDNGTHNFPIEALDTETRSKWIDEKIERIVFNVKQSRNAEQTRQRHLKMEQYQKLKAELGL